MNTEQKKVKKKTAQKVPAKSRKELNKFKIIERPKIFLSRAVVMQPE